MTTCDYYVAARDYYVGAMPRSSSYPALPVGYYWRRRLAVQAIDLTLEGCEWARKIGASELVVWSAFDGYDYCHQVRTALPAASKSPRLTEPYVEVGMLYRPHTEAGRRCSK